MSSSYQAPLKDLRFALYDVLDVGPLFARLGFAEATPDLLDAVLEEAGRFTTTVLAPLNHVGDEVGCTLDTATGEVSTPPGFKQAYEQFAQGGWSGLTAPKKKANFSVAGISGFFSNSMMPIA